MEPSGFDAYSSQLKDERRHKMSERANHQRQAGHTKVVRDREFSWQCVAVGDILPDQKGAQEHSRDERAKAQDNRPVIGEKMEPRGPLPPYIAQTTCAT